MSKETSREVLGVGERGEVVVIEVEDNVVNGTVTHAKHYLVRMGAFTMQETKSKSAAFASARALVR